MWVQYVPPDPIHSKALRAQMRVGALHTNHSNMALLPAKAIMFIHSITPIMPTAAAAKGGIRCVTDRSSHLAGRYLYLGPNTVFLKGEGRGLKRTLVPRRKLI